MALLLPSSISLFPSPSPVPSTPHSFVASTHRCFSIASSNLAIRLSWKSLSSSPLPLQKKIHILVRASSEAPEGSALPPPEEKEEPENPPEPSNQQRMYDVRMKLRMNRKLRKFKQRMVRKWRQTRKGKKVIKLMKKKKKGKKKNKKRKGKRRVY